MEQARDAEVSEVIAVIGGTKADSDGKRSGRPSRGRAAGRGDPQDSPKRIPSDANVTDNIEQAEKIFQVFT